MQQAGVPRKILPIQPILSTENDNNMDLYAEALPTNPVEGGPYPEEGSLNDLDMNRNPKGMPKLLYPCMYRRLFRISWKIYETIYFTWTAHSRSHWSQLQKAREDARQERNSQWYIHPNRIKASPDQNRNPTILEIQSCLYIFVQ